MGDGKKRNLAHITGELAVNFLRHILPIEWVVREYNPDYGIDLSVEIFEKYKDSFMTTGEHLYFQVKGTQSLKKGSHKVYERKNVEKLYENHELYKEIEVINFSIETSLLATVERMGSAVPVLLIVVDLVEQNAYFLCLNDYIEKVIVPIKPDYTAQDKIKIDIPLSNVIKTYEDVLPIKWYAKRPKLFALISKVNYQCRELRYMDDAHLKDDILHFAKIIRRNDAWSASEYFYALNNVQQELDYFLKTGTTQLAEQTINRLKNEGINVDEENWETNYSYKELSYRDAQNAIALRTLWDNICNCGDILEDLAKEWFLPTYMGLIT